MMLTRFCILRSKFIRIYCFCLLTLLKYHFSGEVHTVIDVNIAALSMKVQIPLQDSDFVSFRCMPRSGIAGCPRMFTAYYSQ